MKRQTRRVSHRTALLVVDACIAASFLVAACSGASPAPTKAVASPTPAVATSAPAATAAPATSAASLSATPAATTAATAAATAAATTAATAAPQLTATPPGPQGLPAGWQLYANANAIHAVAVNTNDLYAASVDGVLVWDLTSGALVKHWDWRDGLTNNNVTAISYCPLPGQPPLLVGTRAGLDLYDPATGQWQHLTQASGGLQGTEVQALGCDLQNGRGLIGYASGGLDIFDARAHQIRHLAAADGLISDDVTALAFVPATNEIWAGSPFGVSVIGASGIKTLTKDAGQLPDNDIRAITADAAGTIWLGTFSGLVKYDKGAAKLYTSDTVPNLPSSAAGVAAAGDGSLWVAGLGGDVCHFDPKTAKCLTVPASPAEASFYSSVAVDAQGAAYLGSDGQGVIVFAGAAARQLTTTVSSLGTNNVQALAQDQGGKIWLLTDKGAYRLDPKDETAKWDFFPSDDSGLASGAANVILAAAKGGLWFGGYDGASFYDGTAWKHFTAKDNGLLDDDIRALALDAQGQVWFGGPKGISIWNGTTVTKLNKQAGLPDEDIQTLLADGAHVWAGTSAGGLLRFDGGKWQAFTTDNAGLPSNDIRALARASDGSLLVGTANGIARFDGQKASAAGLDGDTVVALAVGPNGQAWAGTVFSGAYQFDGKQWQPLPTLPGSTVLALAVDPLGGVWFGLEKEGLARYVPPSGAVTVGAQPTATGSAVTVALGAEQALPNTTIRFRPPAAWSATPYGLALILTPADADSVTGPSLTLAGGAQKDLFPKASADASLDDLLNSYVATWLNTGGKAQVSQLRQVQVGGQPARAAEVTWSTDKFDGFSGRLVIAQPGAGQVFIMLGGGTPEKAPALLSTMDAVLATVQFK
jgi:ligand-binding sensor domain-containing protein